MTLDRYSQALPTMGDQTAGAMEDALAYSEVHRARAGRPAGAGLPVSSAKPIKAMAAYSPKCLEGVFSELRLEGSRKFAASERARG